MTNQTNNIDQSPILSLQDVIEIQAQIFDRAADDTSKPLTLDLRGDPGCGKTASVAQAVALANERRAARGDRPIVFRKEHHRHAPSIMIDEWGIVRLREPNAAGLVTHDYTAPAWLPILGDGEPDDDIYVILLDEAAQVRDVAQQSGIAQLINERQIHGHKLKPNVFFILTGNLITSRAGAGNFLSHLQDRVVQLVVGLDVLRTVAYMQKAGAPQKLVECLYFCGKELFSFDPDRRFNVTPRGVLEKIGSILRLNLPQHAVMALMAGAVGPGAAAQMDAFFKLREAAPRFEDIIADPQRSPLPDRVDMSAAVIAMLASRTDHGTFDAAFTYVRRICDKLGRPDFAAAFITSIVVRERQRLSDGEAFLSVQETKTFINWAETEGFELYV